MGTDVSLVCFACGKSFLKRRAEYNRQTRRGVDRFFCSRICSVRTSNREHRNKPLDRVCPHCRKTFTSHTGAKGATFCSRSCASAGSLTPKRRGIQRLHGLLHAENLILPEAALKIREAWKYSELASNLMEHAILHEFEYRVDCAIFDLALPDRKLLVEFDGPYHRHPSQTRMDGLKDQIAKQQGWNLLRIVTDAGIIPGNVLKGFLGV